MYHNIEGKSVATVNQMKAYIKSVNPKVSTSVLNMIKYYISEGEIEGIRGDYAFAQSCLETGNFTFSGSAVTLDQNNFCGMGVTSNGMKGNSFKTPQLGIRAQIQHLKAYGSKKELVNKCIDTRFKYVKRGCSPYIEWLGMKENPNGYGWAAGANYGSKILSIYNKIISMQDDEKNNEDSWIKTGTGTCIGDDVNVREEPNGTIIGSLNKGNVFEVDGKVSGDWVHIKSSNKTMIGIGWMHKKYVKINNTSNNNSNTPSSNKNASLTENVSIKLPIIKSGYKGTAVSMVQAMLCVKVTGVMDEDTIKALNTFKKNVNLSQNSIVDEDTWKRIIEHMKANTFIK